MQTAIKTGLSFEDYKVFFDKLISEGKTTGENQSETLIEFTKLNKQRMKRVEKQFKIEDEFLNKLQNYETPMNWTILIEAWCGDAAQNLPIIAKIAELIPNTELSILFRDENLELMYQHLTNGGRAVPKLIATSKATNEVLWTWGARPKEIQAFVMNFKKENPEASHEDFNQELHLYYGKNRGAALMNDFKAIL